MSVRMHEVHMHVGSIVVRVTELSNPILCLRAVFVCVCVCGIVFTMPHWGH